MRIRVGSTVKFALGLALFQGCTPSPQGPPASGILVIAIDALRFDHLGVSGYDRATSPALDALAAEGVFFREAYAAAPWQVPAHMALLSSADPRIARTILPPAVTVNQATQWHLPEEAPHPVAQFLSEGFSTAMFYDHQNLAPVYGYQRGFELYQGPPQDAKPGGADYGSEAVFRRFDQWLTRIPQQQSWFAYLELADLERLWTEDADPHWDTYFAPRPELSRVPPVGDAPHLFFALPRSRWSGGMSTLGEYEARYDGALLRIDSAFRRLRTHLEQLGRFANTTVVVVGAYGMSFGESGLLLDSGTFSDSDLHVPLIVRPGSTVEFQAGLTCDELVSTVDLMPTLQDMAGLPPTENDDGGVSFAAAISGKPHEPRPFAHSSCGFQDGFAVIDLEHCFERTWPARTLERQYSFQRSGPGRAQDQLGASWFGDSEGRVDVMREVLHDRKHEPGLGHVFLPTSDSPVAKGLAERGEAWLQKVEARRAKLQGQLAPSPGAVSKSSLHR